MQIMLLVVKIALLPFMVLMLAFFEGSETALVSLSGMNISSLKKRKPHIKNLFEFWESFPDRVLAFIIIGNTLATVACGVLAASIGRDFTLFTGISEKWLIPLLSFMVTAVVFVFGGVLAKIISRFHSERVASASIIFLVPLTRMFHTVVRVLVRIAGFFVLLLGAEPQKEIPTLSAAELRGMLETEGTDEPSSPSRRILGNILEFGQLRVKDVQKPAKKLLAVDLKSGTKEIIAEIARSSYSRIPAYRDSLDNTKGIIYSRDLLASWRTEGLILISDLLRPAYFVGEDMRISELLREFKKGHYHFALVQDDAGRVTGFITIEDVLEEIVGEVYDESKL